MYFQDIYMGFKENYLEYVAKHIHGFPLMFKGRGKRKLCRQLSTPSLRCIGTEQLCMSLGHSTVYDPIVTCYFFLN